MRAEFTTFAKRKDISPKGWRMLFSTQWSYFLSLLCLLIKVQVHLLSVHEPAGVPISLAGNTELLISLYSSGDAVWCECSLDRMEIQGGTFTLSNGQNEGSILRYQCPKGFYPHPELAYRCQQNNQWTPRRRRSKCLEVECPDPNVLQNGYISPYKQRYSSESTITYHCSSGYTLRGPLQRTCSENGKWNGSNPVCQCDLPGDCPDPGVPPGGTRTGNTFEIGDKVTFTCNRNMILMGSEERECQLNNRWSGSEPSCYYKHTYDTPWDVTNAFSIGIKNTLTSNLVNDTQQERSIKLKRHGTGTLNIFIALDISESITEEDLKNATKAIITLIKKIATFSVYPKYEVIFFSSKIIPVNDIIRFNELNPLSLIKLVDALEQFNFTGVDKYGTNINAVFDHFLNQLGVIKKQNDNFKEHHHVIILFSDGGYNRGGSPLNTIKRIKTMVYMDEPEKREDHLDIYVFGIGTPVYDENLKPLTIGNSHYYKLKDIKELQKTFDDIIDESDVMDRCGLYKDTGMLRTIEQKRKKFPWIMYITVNTGGEHCLGSLVSRRFVLTAAHCIKNKTDTAGIKVTDHHNQNRGHEHIHRVETVHVHEKYNIDGKSHLGVTEFYDYDVALLELERDVSITTSLRPICLPCTEETNAALKQTFNCSEQEYFLLQNNPNPRVTFLSKIKERTEKTSEDNLGEKVVRVKLGTDRDECIKHALMAPSVKSAAVTDNFLCTGGLKPNIDKIACKGDSGSAVFMDHEKRTIQVALVSWGTEILPGCKNEELVDSKENSRDFHINLFKVVPFLKSILGKTDEKYAPLVFVD